MKRKHFFLIALLIGLSSKAYAGLPSLDDTPLPPREPGPLSKVYTDEILIDAPMETVWDVILDLPRYTEWNPWVKEAEGDMDKGGIVWVKVKLGPIDMKAKHVVLLNEPYKRFCWRDAGWNANFVYGQRCRTLEMTEEGLVHYKVELLVDGVLSSLANWGQGPFLQAGMASETEALKARAEAMSDQ